MPTYRFNKDGEVWDEFMGMSEKETFLENNPDINQVPVAIAIVGGIEGRTHKVDDGFKENMSRIAEAHPNSPLASRYGSNENMAKKKARQVIKKRTGAKVTDGGTSHNLNKAEIIGGRHTYK